LVNELVKSGNNLGVKVKQNRFYTFLKQYLVAFFTPKKLSFHTSMTKLYFSCFLFWSASLYAQPTLELFPSLETIGVNVQYNNLTDPETDLVTILEYRLSGEIEWRQGFPPTPIANKNRCSGSIFWLNPATNYEVRVQMSDPSTPGLNATLEGTVSTRPEPDFAASLSQLIVSPTGTGTVCSEGQPCSLATALAQVQAGQDIELLGGSYFIGGLTLTKSGIFNAPITIRGRTGEAAILDGSDPEPYTWLPGNGTPGIFYTNLKEANANVNCVTVDNIRLFPYRKLLYDLVNLNITCILGYPVPAGVSGMFRDPRPSTVIPFQFQNPLYKKLFVHLDDDSNPAHHEVMISLQKSGLVIENQSFIRFHNLQFQNYGVRPGGVAVWLKNCDEVIFDHCHFSHNDFNITVSGNSDRFTAQFCTFRDNTDWDTYISKATYEPASPALCDGTLPDLYPFSDRVAEVGAIFFDHDCTGRGLMIRGNLFNGYMDGSKGSPSGFAPEQAYSQEIDIFDNEFNGADDGIELEGWAGNLRFYRNTLRNCGAAISLAPVQTGPVYLLRNVISDFHEGNSTIEGYADLVNFGGTPMKFQSGYTGKIGKVYAFHNTICVKGSGKAYGLEVFPGSGVLEGFEAKNNIFFAEQNHALLLRGSPTQLPSVTLDYNNYLNADTLIKVQNALGAQYFLDLPTFTTALGFEVHGLNADPMFMDTSANDYRLLPGSPCQDAGVLIPGINDQDFLGVAPDMGAMESAINPTVAPVSLAILRILPNPAQDFVRFETNIVGHWKGTMFDALGRRVMEIENQAEVRIESLKPGLYFVKISWAGKDLMGKFAKH